MNPCNELAPEKIIPLGNFSLDMSIEEGAQPSSLDVLALPNPAALVLPRYIDTLHVYVER